MPMPAQVVALPPSAPPVMLAPPPVEPRTSKFGWVLVILAITSVSAAAGAFLHLYF
jgi:hypothetical protein